MIKHWQTIQEYLCFLANVKTTFDSSEKVQLQSELSSPREKLRLFDTDAAMRFLEPFYSNTGKPALNQPQILRSFILFPLGLHESYIPFPYFTGKTFEICKKPDKPKGKH